MKSSALHSLPLPDDPVAAVVVAAMLIILGWGGWQAFPALRRDWQRNRHMEEIEVTEAVRRLASETLDEVRIELRQARDELRQAREELRIARSENTRLQGRVATLEQENSHLYRHVGAVEAWVHDKVPAGVARTMPVLTEAPDR